MLDPDDAAAWLPLAQLIYDSAPERTEASRLTVRLSSGSLVDLEITDDRVTRERDTAVTDALFDLLEDLAPDHEIDLDLRTTSNAAFAVDLVHYPRAARGDGYGMTIEIVPDSISPPYRREPVDTHRPTGRVDLPALERVLRERLPDARGASEQELTAAQQALGVQFTEELLLLYRIAAAGELVWDDQDPDESEAFYGLEIVPLGSDVDLRATYTPAGRFSGWEFPTLQDPPVDLTGRVQALGSAPTWVPFGHDWGGNVYAVDLSPGPDGHLGQVVFLDHEQSVGATFVAESLTELLVERREHVAEVSQEEIGVAYVNDDAPPTGVLRPETEVLVVTTARAPVDLREVGAVAPGLWALEAASGTLADVLEIEALPALELLTLGAADWRRLLELDRLPATLRAAGLSESDPEVLEALLSAFGVDSVRRVDLSGELAARSVTRKRRWFRR